MSTFKFIHAADIHLGSRIERLANYYGAPLEQLRNATELAFENLTDLALQEKVAALLIAGDLFDGPWNDAAIGLRLAEQFRRLDSAGIRVLLIRGNHDAQSQVRSTIRWPDNVTEFPCDAAATEELDCGLVVHGRSFAEQKTQEDLAATYPPAIANKFNVGMLHTSLSGDAVHDTYAPTNTSVLLSHGYHYWALGHIHIPTIQSLGGQQAWIGYSGNIQGRSVREIGARGCYVVTVIDGEMASHDFHETDVARWTVMEIDVTSSASIEEIESTIESELQRQSASIGQRCLISRIVLVGATNLHSVLQTQTQQSILLDKVQNTANAIGNVCIERLKIRTQPAKSARELAEANLAYAAIREQAEIMQQELQDGSTLLSDELIAEAIELVEKKCGSMIHVAMREWAQQEDKIEKFHEWLQSATSRLESEILSGDSRK